MNFVILRRTDREKELFEIDETFNTKLKMKKHPCFEKIESIKDRKILKAKEDENYIFFIPDREGGINIDEDLLISILKDLRDTLKSHNDIRLFVHFGGDVSSIDTEKVKNKIKQSVDFLKDKNLEVIAISFGKLSDEEFEKLKNTQSCIERIKKFLEIWAEVKEEKQKEETGEVTELAQTASNIVVKNIEHLKEEIKELEQIEIENCKEPLKKILCQLKEIVKANYDIYIKLLEQLNKK